MPATPTLRTFAGFPFGSTAGLPAPTAADGVAADLVDALRARFASCADLVDVSGFYAYGASDRPALPALVINALRETSPPLTFTPTYPAEVAIQVTVLDDDPRRGARLRDAAFGELAPRVRPPLLFQGGMDGGRVPGMKWDLRQTGAGRGGSPVWAFVFEYNLHITRYWPTR